MRRHYVVTYDVSDDKRRNKVFTTLHGFGEHVQYSVFFCELSDREYVQLRGQMRAAINEAQDQVLLVDLGKATRPLEVGLEVVGRAYEPADRTLVV